MDETHRSLMIAEWDLCRLYQELDDTLHLFDTALRGVEGVNAVARSVQRARDLIATAADRIGKPLAAAEQKLTV